MSPDGAQQRVVADRHLQPARKAGGGSAAERKRQMMHDLIEPRRATRPRRQDIGVEAFGENPTRTHSGVAAKSPRQKDEPNNSTGDRQIGQPPRKPAVDAPGLRPALRTWARRPRGSHPEEQAGLIIGGALHDKAGRNERRGLQTAHRVDSFPETNANRRLDFIKIESEPRFGAN